MPEGGFGGIQLPGGGSPTLVRTGRHAALRVACGRYAAGSGCRPPGCRLKPLLVTADGRQARSCRQRRGGRPLGPASRAAPNETPRALEENAGRANKKGPPVASLSGKHQRTRKICASGDSSAIRPVRRAHVPSHKKGPLSAGLVCLLMRAGYCVLVGGGFQSVPRCLGRSSE